VLGDKGKGVGLLQAQQDGKRQIEAPLQLVQVRSRLQQRPAVPARAPCPTHKQLSLMRAIDVTHLIPCKLGLHHCPAWLETLPCGWLNNNYAANYSHFSALPAAPKGSVCSAQQAWPV
jgi:hypothetical protein